MSGSTKELKGPFCLGDLMLEQNKEKPHTDLVPPLKEHPDLCRLVRSCTDLGHQNRSGDQGADCIWGGAHKELLPISPHPRLSRSLCALMWVPAGLAFSSHIAEATRFERRRRVS